MTAAAPPAVPDEDVAKLTLKEMNGAAPAVSEVKPEEGGAEEDEEDDEGEDGAEEDAEATEKKKSESPSLARPLVPTIPTDSRLLRLAEKKKKSKGKKKTKAVQTEPPTVPVSRFFKSNAYPVGETHPYLNDNAYRTTSEEMRHKERLLLDEPSDSAFNYNSIRRAAEVHRQVRKYARNHIKPGMTMTEIAEMIENGTRALVEENGMQAGIGFPTGVSRNECAAHYTPNAGDTIVLQAEDVLKVDFGVHVNGRIVDSAFTLNWEPTYDRLLEAVKDATETGVREAGIDVRMGDIGRAIQEVMESYEVEVDGETKQVKSIRNLTGHSIAPYIIHGGKSVPICAPQGDDREENDEADQKMEEGEYFAIETFGSTGNGYVEHKGACSHYARIPEARAPLTFDSSKKLLSVIERQFGTLPWCKRYLDRIGQKNYTVALNELVNKGIVQDYPPLVDMAKGGCQTAQFEHTIILRPTCKEVVTRGDDY